MTITPQDVINIRLAYKTLFESADRDVVLKDLRTRFHQHQPIVSTDAMEMAYLEGQRSVVLIIQNLMKDPENNLTEMIEDG